MRELCLDEAVLQSYCDGELSPDRMETAATHLASCEACASRLSEVENENAMLMGAFAPEMELSVPTAALRERLDKAITGLEPAPVTKTNEGWSLGAWLSSFAGLFTFTPQRAMGYASLVVVLAFAAIFAAIQLRRPAPPTELANGNTPSTVAEVPTKSGGTKDGNDNPVNDNQVNDTPVVNTPGQKDAKPTPTVLNAGYKPNKARRSNRPKDSGAPVPKKSAPAQLLPGESNYLEAIASLTTAIKGSSELMMTPTVRVEYERNLAVVDQAITVTRREAERNPNDREAAQFLYSAYQNKVELLSVVADQARLERR